MSLKDRISKNVKFVHYQDGNLIYECESDGFQFPVPIQDCGSARFPAQEKGLLFMRWIRKHMSLIDNESSGRGSEQ